MELLKQIGEKEKERIKTRQQLFEEGMAIKVEKQKRDDTLKETMLKKMNTIRYGIRKLGKLTYYRKLSTHLCTTNYYCKLIEESKVQILSP